MKCLMKNMQLIKSSGYHISYFDQDPFQQQKHISLWLSRYMKVKISLIGQPLSCTRTGFLKDKIYTFDTKTNVYTRALLVITTLAQFPHLNHTLVSPAIMEVMHDQHVEGIKLTLQTPQCEPNKKNFINFIKHFSDCNVFLSSMALLSNRCFSPNWFRAIFSRKTPTTHAQLNVVWASLFTPTLLSYRIELTGKCYGFIGYQPNQVSQQIGLSQMLPKSLFTCENDICWSGRTFNKHVDCLKFHNKHFLELLKFTFQTSYLTTKEFKDQWCQYYQQFDATTFVEKLNATFTVLEDRLTMSKLY